VWYICTPNSGNAAADASAAAGGEEQGMGSPPKLLLAKLFAANELAA